MFTKIDGYDYRKSNSNKSKLGKIFEQFFKFDIYGLSLKFK